MDIYDNEYTILEKIKISIKETSNFIKTNCFVKQVNNMDIYISYIFCKLLKLCKNIRYIYCKNQSKKTINKDGKYIITLDPLVQKEVILNNGITGTIFSIIDIEKNLIIIAGYAIYGPSTQVVIATNEGVDIYQMIDNLFTKIITGYKMPLKGYTYCLDLSKKYLIDQRWRIIIDISIKNKYKHLWSGSLLNDFNRVLLNGGFITCPNTKNEEDLYRIIHTVKPLVFIFKKAGGYEWGDNGLIEDESEKIVEINSKTPFFFGSKYEYDIYLKNFYNL